jgi:hypothetical protein
MRFTKKWNSRRSESYEDRKQRARNGEAHNRSSERQKKCLCQRLPDQPASVCAERQAHRYFSIARSTASHH